MCDIIYPNSCAMQTDYIWIYKHNSWPIYYIPSPTYKIV